MKKFVILAVGLSMGVLQSVADDSPSRISTDKPNTYNSYPMISIPMTPGKMPQHYNLFSVPNDDAEIKANCPLPTKNVFKSVKVNAGAELKINSYLVSKNILEADAKFEKGPDSPKFEEIREALDSKHTEKFLRILTKLSEERRSAETAAERAAIVPVNPDSNDPCTQIYFGTGFFEVSGKGLNSGDKDLRYFVQAKDVLSGNAKLNLKESKIEALKGFSVVLFRELSDNYQNVGDTTTDQKKAKLDQIMVDFENACSGQTCAMSEEAKLGSAFVDLIKVFRADSKELLDPAAENKIILRKEMCLLKRTITLCGMATLLKELDSMIAAEQINCNNLEHLLVSP